MTEFKIIKDVTEINQNSFQNTNTIQQANKNIRNFVQYFILQNTTHNENHYTFFQRHQDTNSKNTIPSDEIKQIACTFDTIKNPDKFNYLVETLIRWNEKYCVAVAFNSTENKRLTKKNVKLRNHLFVDIDGDPTAEEMNEIVQTILMFGFQPSYIGRTPNGLHILIPIKLETTLENERMVRQFNNDLIEINSKVDEKVINANRVIRFPESIHHKNDDPKVLTTIYFNESVTKEQIENNNQALQQFVPNKDAIKYDENKLITKNYKHIKSNFFAELINAQGSKREKYYKKLNNCDGKVQTLLKNMAIYANVYTETKDAIINFWAEYEQFNIEKTTYVSKLQSWIQSSLERSEDESYEVDNKLNQISYHELKSWLENNNWDEMLPFIEKDLLEFRAENGHPLKYFFDNFHICRFNNLTRMDYYVAVKHNGNSKYLNKATLAEQIEQFGDLLGYDCFEVFGLKDDPKFDTLNVHEQYDKLYSHMMSYILKYKLITVLHDKNYQPTYDKDNHYMYFQGKKYLNEFTAPKLFYYHDKSVCTQDGFPLIRELLFAQCGKDPKGYEWFMKRLAIIFQNPTEKCSTVSVFIGDQGTGKTTMFEQIFRPLLEHNTCTLDQTYLEGGFTDAVAKRMIIFANEVGQNESDGKLANKVKNLATDATISIREMYKPPVTIQNYGNWIFTTNDSDPIKLEPNDRRYTIFESKFIDETKKGDYFSQVWYPKWRKSKDSELKNFISFLKNVPVTPEEVNNPYHNEVRHRLMERHLDSVESFIYYFQNDEDILAFSQEHHIFSGRDLDDVFMSTANKYKNNLMTFRDLYKIYRRFCEECGFNYKNRYNSFRDVLLSKIKLVEKNLKIGNNMLTAKSRRVICIDDLKLSDSYKIGDGLK